MNFPSLSGAMRVLRNLCRKDQDRFLWQVPGVIHVGGNSGPERIEYADKLLSVVWVEAHPRAFSELQANIRPFPEQRAICALVSESNGEKLTFNLSEGSGAASSILPLKDVHAIWPDVRYESSLEMVGTTLPTLLEEHGIQISDYPALVMDTQGSELKILRGSKEILREFLYIKTEVADFEAYEGCALFCQIDEFLAEHDFVMDAKIKFASAGPEKNYYDVIYRRRDFTPRFPCRLPLRRPERRKIPV